MTASVHKPIELPPPMVVRNLLEDLLGRNVDVVVGDAWAPLPRDMAATAEYVDDRLTLRAVVLLDLPMAVFAGAAVGLVPARGAQEMVEKRMPNVLIEENLYEVLNVLAAVLNGDDAVHVKITTMSPPGEDPALDVLKITQRLTGRLDLKVEIDGYGEGRLALVIV
jgi:hypothetical protein